MFWNYNAHFFISCFSVNLVERDTCPNGYQLVDPDASGKKTQMDLGNLKSKLI